MIMSPAAPALGSNKRANMLSTNASADIYRLAERVKNTNRMHHATNLMQLLSAQFERCGGNEMRILITGAGEVVSNSQ